MIIVAKICAVAQIIVLEFLTIGIHRALADKFSGNTFSSRAHVGFGAGVAVVARTVDVHVNAEPARPPLLARVAGAHVLVAAVPVAVAGVDAAGVAPVAVRAVAVVAFLDARMHVPVTARGQHACVKAIIRVVVVAVIALLAIVNITVSARGQRAVVPAPVRINIISVVASFARVNHRVAAAGKKAIFPARIGPGIIVQGPVVALFFSFDNPVAALAQSILLDDILPNVHPIFHILFTVLRVILRSFIATACLENKCEHKNKT